MLHRQSASSDGRENAERSRDASPTTRRTYGACFSPGVILFMPARSISSTSQDCRSYFLAGGMAVMWLSDCSRCLQLQERTKYLAPLARGVHWN